MEKIQQNKEQNNINQNIGNSGIMSQIIMNSPLMQQRKANNETIFGDIVQKKVSLGEEPKIMNSSVPIQRAISAKITGEAEFVEYTNLSSLAKKFNFNLKNNKDALFTKLQTNPKIPASYLDNYATMKATREEVGALLNDLVNTSTAQIELDANDTATFINQFYNAISGLITDGFIANYPYLKKANAFAADYGGYLANLRTINKKINKYENSAEYEPLKIKQIELRLNKLKEEKDSLENDLDTAVTNDEGIDTVLDRYNTFVANFDNFKKLWDNVAKLDYDYTNDNVPGKLTTFLENSADNPDLVASYEVGEDDGASVGYDYDSNLACTLYSILHIKPGWMGARALPDGAEDLHNILRETENLNDYDEDKKVAAVRYLAGLKPTSINKNLVAYTNEIGPGKKFIADVQGSHTYAVMDKGDGYKRYSNEGRGALAGNIKLLAKWD